MGIEVISFDVDGTLVDPEYNDIIWQKAVPDLVAKKKGILFQEALKIVQNEYDRIGEGDYRWYDIKYWIDYFQLKVDYQDLLGKYEDKIIIYPEVPYVLDVLSKKYPLICITTMPREFLIPKIKKIKHFFHSTYSTLSDFKQIKNNTIYQKVSQLLNITTDQLFHIGDHEIFDYHAARESGCQSVLIKRNNTGSHLLEKQNDMIQNLSELLIKKIL